MVTMTIDYQGTLRCQARHGPSAASLNTDAPVDNHGRGESFSPTDLLATAAATCMLTIMGIKAEDKGWTLAGTRATVVKQMSSEGPRRVAALEIEVQLPATLDDAAVDLLQRVALACPVLQSLHPDVVIRHRFTQG